MSEKHQVTGVNLVEFAPDFCIVVRRTGEIVEDVANIKQLTTALHDHGIYVQVRSGDGEDILVLAKSSVTTLNKKAKDAAVKDWLFEIPTAIYDEAEEEGDGATDMNAGPGGLSPAERLRLIHGTIMHSEKEGGAGINPHVAKWSFVKSILPLHDSELNAQWVKAMSTQWLVGDCELNFIRKQFGEKVGMYFAFLQFYFIWSLPPAVVGLLCHFVLGDYSAIFAVFNILWAITFVQMWKRRQNQLAIRWGVKETSNLKACRPQFKGEYEVPDPVTGEIKSVYPQWKTYLRKLSFVPISLVFAFILIGFQTAVFAIEIFVVQIYDGPGKQYLGFLPAILVAAVSPAVTSAYLYFVDRLTNWENHETEDDFEVSYTQKQFVLQFLLSFMPLFLTSYIYLPFGYRIVPHLDFIRTSLSQKNISIAQDFEINSLRLHQQMVYFSVTAQVVNLCMETVVPYIQRIVFSKAKQMASKEILHDDDPNEAKFLSQLRAQVALPEYNVQEDYRQLIVQFGGVLFSPVWPLATVAALINNWVQLRGDAVKICMDTRRPVPCRAESIGPWLDTLTFLAWLSSITTSSIIAMFSTMGKGHISVVAHTSLVSIRPWVLFAVVLLSEHFYFIASVLIEAIVESIPTKEVSLSRRNRYLLRKRVLSENESLVTRSAIPNGIPAENAWKSVTMGDVISQTRRALDEKSLQEKKNQ